MKKSRFEQKLDKIYDLSKVLHEEGRSAAECRYAEIVATTLLLVEDSLSVLRTLGFLLLGAFIAHLF